MGKTFSEKVLGTKANKEVEPGEIVTVNPDYILSHDNSAAIIQEFRKLSLEKVKSAEKIVIVLDHVVPASSEKHAQNHKVIREGKVRTYDLKGSSSTLDVAHAVAERL